MKYVSKEPMGNEKSHELFLKYCQSVENEKIRICKLISDTSYIDWLIKYLEEKNIASSNLQSNEKALLTKEENDNISDLSILYKIVEKYANHKYIISEETELGLCYYIRYKDVTIQIISVQLDHEEYYCRQITCEPLINPNIIIDFEEILANKTLYADYDLKKCLEELASYIKFLQSTGVPAETIRVTVDQTLCKK